MSLMNCICQHNITIYPIEWTEWTHSISKTDPPLDHPNPHLALRLSRLWKVIIFGPQKLPLATSDLGMGGSEGDATGDTSSGIWDSHPFHSCLWILWILWILWVLWVQGKAEMRGNPPSSPPFCLCRASLFPPPGQHSSASRPGSDDSSLCRVGSDTSPELPLGLPCSSMFIHFLFLSFSIISSQWKTIILRVWRFWFQGMGQMLYQALLFLRKLQFSRHRKEIERGKQRFWRDPHPKPCKPRPDWKVLSTNKLRFS